MSDHIIAMIVSRNLRMAPPFFPVVRVYDD
jgi:hypothetical protein